MHGKRGKKKATKAKRCAYRPVAVRGFEVNEKVVVRFPPHHRNAVAIVLLLELEVDVFWQPPCLVLVWR